MTTSTSTYNDNNTSADLPLTTTTVNATVNLNNSSGDDSVTTDGTGTTTINANNSSGDDTLTINGAASATVNLNNSTGSDDVDISDMSGAPLATTVNLNNGTGKEDNVDIAGTTVNATVNMNNSGVVGYSDDVSISGTNVNATVNLNNSAGNDVITIVGSSSTNATVNLNNSGGNDDITIGSTTGATTATVNLNASGGTDIVNVVGATTTATVNLANATGQGDVVMLVGKGTGTINATNSTGNDTLIGANSSDTINGGIGNDTVDLEGAGTIYAGSGNDLGIYTLSDHYSLTGSVLWSINGDVDYYYGQAGSNTLRLVLTQDEANLAAVQSDIAGYNAFLAVHPGVNQTYTFHFGASSGALTVAGWQTLQIAVVTPTISGTAREGQTLTASVTVTGGETGTATYQWQISANGSTGWVNIGGATGSNYTPSEADENHYLRVQTVFTDGIGETVTSTSAPTGPVTDITLAFTAAAAITGTAQEGTPLNAVNGTLNDTDASVTGYQWQSAATANGTYSDIATNGTSSTYTPVEGDEGRFLRVVETATDGDGGPPTTSTSAPTGPVTDITLAFTAAAAITGTAQEGTPLNAVNGTLNDTDASVTGYQWQSAATANGTYSDIATNGTSSTYTPVEGDEGRFLRVVETATDGDGGPPTTSTSAPTGPVTDITLAFTAAAAITGTAQEGTPLNAVNGTLNDTDASVTGYQWQSAATANGTYSDIATNGTSSTYTPVEGDEGRFLRVVETATDGDGGPPTTSTSAPTGPVTDITLAFTAAAAITGTAQEGTPLNAVNGTLNDTDASVTGYQWQSAATANGTYSDIATNGTSSTYTPVEGDEGRFLRVVETATDGDGGPPTTSTSAPTGPVTDITLAFTAAAAITGTAQEGTPLNAVNGTLNDTDASVTGYQWQSAATANGTYSDIATNGTSSTYTPVEGDEGRFLRVVETATDGDGGPPTTSTSAPTGPVTDITLAFTAAAAITGTAQEGTPLNAVNGTLNDTDASVTGYQWQSAATANGTYSDIATNGTSSTYTPVEGDEGRFLRVVETATDGDGGPPTTSTSAPTGPVTDITLAFTAAAAITGTAQEGTPLNAVNGTLNDTDASVTGYQWQSAATANGTYSDIATNGTSSTYTPVEGDEGRFLRVVETATDGDGGPPTTSTSAPTGPVTDITLAFTAAAAITGTAQEGTPLNAVNGTLNDTDASVTGYQWQSAATANGTYSDIATNGTSSTYTPVEGDEGRFLRVVETATDGDGGPPTTSTSAPTGPVTDITLAFTAAAAITGTAQEGTPLNAVNGTLNDTDASVTGYQWQSAATANGTYSDIATNGTSSTYTPVEGDEGRFLRVVETATDGDGGPPTTSTSAPTGPVTDITLAFTAAAAITGTAQEGTPLNAVNGTLNDTDASVTGYQWQSAATANGTYSDIATNGTSSTYTPVEGDEGRFLRVVETATDGDGGPPTTSTSAPTGPVTDITLAFTAAAAITGTAQEGTPLNAVNGTLNDTDASVTGYQWQSAATANGTYSDIATNGTSSTYTPVEGDEGRFLRVVETATDGDGGPPTTSTSAPTGPVTDITLAFTAAAAITGTAQEGTPLNAVNGTLNDTDASVTGYQWQSAATANGTYSDIATNGTSSTYTPVEGDEGRFLRVVETATDGDGGPPTTSTSAPTGPVTDITLAFTAAAAITGTAQEGTPLNAVNGTLNDTDASVTGYQWQSAATANGTYSDIATNGTSSTYTPVEGDEGRFLRVVETATDGDGGPPTTSTSAPTGPVTDITLAFTAAAAITGTAQEGTPLNAVNGTLNDTDASVTGYQWQSAATANGTYSDIATNGTSSTYTPVEGDEGRFLRVVETATDGDGGPPTTSTSAPTGPVTDITLAFTAAAAITGTAQEGTPLNAVNGTLNDTDASVTGYQWQSAATANGTYSDIATNGTSSTYTPVEGDEGRFLRVVETATDGDGGPPTTSTSAPTGPVTDITLAFTAAAAITGTAQEGTPLNAVNGTLNDTDASVTGYQWQSAATANGTYSDIATNGTSSTYTPVEGDEGRFLRVVETATDGDGGPPTTSTSAPTGPVTDITLAFTAAAAITGTAQEGTPLNAVNGTLNDTDASVTGYQWQSAATANGTYSDIATNGTSSTYTPVEGDEGRFLRVVETATDGDGGPPTTSTSAPTGPVTDITLAFTAAAAITGTAQEGTPLNAVNGTLNDTDASVTGYQWQSAATANGTYSDIATNGTSSTYTPVEGDEGRFLRVVETATDGDGGPPTTSTSAPTGPVTDITLAFTAAAAITGTAQEGTPLNAVNGTLNDTDASVTGYQWQSAATANGTYSDIATNGTSSTYTPVEGDEGRFLRVVETATDGDGGPPTTSTSAPTGPVTDITLAFTAAAAITGTAQEGTPLNAVNGTLNDTDASVTGYQWQSAATANGTYSDIATNGTSSTYTPVEGDEGRFLRVVETATDGDGGPPTTSTSAPTGPVTDITLAFTAAAAITGTAQEGTPLNAVNGTLNDTDASVTGYQWQSAATANGTYSDIATNGTSSTYTPVEGDEGRFLRVVETATDGDGGPPTTSTSAPTGPVTDITLAFTAAAAITGTAQEGTPLNAVNGTLNDTDASVTGYQWQSAATANGTYSDIATNGTSSTYTPVEGDEGRFLRVVETATDGDGGPPTTSTSAPTGPVTDITLAFTAAAAITGTAQEGTPLNAVNGTLNDTDASVTGYQWQSAATANGTYSDIATNGTSSTYTPVEGDEGRFLRVVETATDGDGGPPTTSTSAPTGPVTDITLAFTAAAAITGTAQEGTPLNAVNGTLNDTDASVTGYQWQSAATANGTYSDIATNGTSSTYTPVEGDEGRFLRVVETATDGDGGPPTTSTSAPTGPVTDITLAFTAAAAITGTAQEGTPLNAVNGTLNDTDASVTGYQWQSAATANGTYSDIATNGTSSTYTPVEGDEGRFLRVVETATDGDGGPPTTSTSAPTGPVTDITLAFTAAAAITGTAQEGTPLNAVNGTLNDTDASVTGYQWQSAATANGTYSDIATNGTSSTYTPVEGDEGRFLRVVETATDGDGGPPTTSTSAPTGPVTDITLAFTAAAAITGTAQEGTPLNAVNGTLNDTDASVTGYQWQSAATANGTYSDIATNGTSSTYTPVEGDEGRFLRVVETATDGDGGPPTTSTSAPTGPVTDITLAFTAAAAITGTAQEGTPLNAVNGTLNDTDASVTGYQWQSAATANGTYSDIATNGTSSTYTPVEGDEGRFLRVVETATDGDGGPPTTSTSAPTGPVTDITLAFTAAAAITGTAQEGTPLNAVNGTLNDTDASVTGYQWQSAATANGTYSDIATNGTSSTYTPVEGDEGRFLRVVETATDGDGGPPTTSTSAPTGPVTDITLAFTAAAAITGTAQEGTPLNAVNGTLNDTDASVTGYQWQSAATANGTYSDIATNGTSSTYTPVEGDEGRFLRVVETATDGDGGPPTTSTSAPTGPVTEISLKPTIAVASNTGTNGTNKATAVFTVTFAEAVSGVTTADFVPFGTETTASITSVSGSAGSSFTVTVNYTSNGGGGDRGKSLGINFVNNTTVHDSEAGESGNLAVNTNITTPQISSLAPVGTAESPINLGLGDPSNIGAVTTLIVSGMPSDWSLNQGAKNGDGSWTVTTSDPSSLMVTTGSTFAGAMLLNVSESWSNADGSAGSAFVSDNVEAYPASPIFAVSGDDTLTGGSVGNNEFVFAQPIGNDTVYNFNAGNDTIDLIGFTGLGSFADIQSKLANDANGNAVVAVGTGESITLMGVGSTALTASNFIFNQEPTTTNTGAMTIGDGAILPLGGTIDNTGTIALNSTGDESDLEILVPGATLQGGGQVVLSDNTENVVFGGDASAVLTNVDNTISGAGQLGDGQMTLVNQGVIDATGSNALVVNTGSNTVVNTGTLEATGNGGLVVNSAVSGGGNAVISGSSTLEFAQASDANVNFAAGAAGTLKLDQSGSFTGTVSGLAAGESFDLADIGFSAVATLGYAANALGTGGTLTVSDGMHTTNLALLGQYAAAGFQAVADQGSGTIVTYTPTQAGTTDPTLLTNPQHTA